MTGSSTDRGTPRRQQRRFSGRITGRGLTALPVLCVILPAFFLGACSAEKRPPGPAQPQDSPNGPNDRRIALIENNAYQIGQGGRYFAWYGCSACHAIAGAGGDLASGSWKFGGSFDRVYRSIQGHGAGSARYGARIPAEQLWQLAAYVRSLPALPPAKRRRQNLDQIAEPQGDNWSEPVK